MFSLKKILVVGSANVDFCDRSTAGPGVGRNHPVPLLPKDLRRKGANQAYACGRLGGDTAFLNAVGDDPLGGELVRNLQQANVDTRAIRTVDGVSTGMAVVCVDEAGQFVIPASLRTCGRSEPAGGNSGFRDRSSAGGDDGDGCGEEICGGHVCKGSWFRDHGPETCEGDFG